MSGDIPGKMNVARPASPATMKTTLGLLPMIALSAALTSPAHAQQSGELEVELDEISVEAQDSQPRNTNEASPAIRRIPTTVQNTPQTINVITSEQIQERGLTSLSDVITRVPGVTMSAGEGGGGGQSGDAFNIRGLSAVGNIFQDGVRDVGVYHRDPFNLEQVEVHMGSTGTTLGRGGGGGSINLQSKRARDYFFADIFGTIGTSDYYRGSFDVNVPITPEVAARLNAVGLSRGFADRDHVFLNRWGVAPTVTFGMTSDTRLTLSYLYQQDYGRPDNGVPRFGVPVANGGDGILRPVTELGVRRGNYYGFVEDYESYRTHMATAILEHDFTPDISFTNVSRVGFYDTERFVNTMPPGSIYNPATCPTPTSVTCTLAPNYSTRGMYGASYQNQSTLTANFDTGRFSHEAAIGLDLSREDLHHLSYAFSGPAFPPINLINPVLRPHNRTRALSGDIHHIVDTIGASLYDRMHLGGGFYAIGGLRLENYSVNSRNVFTGATAGFNQTLFSWQGALQYKPIEDHTYYVALSNTQLPTSPTTGYTGLPTRWASSPYEVTNYEIGGKWNLFGGRLGLGAAAFYQTRSNEVTTDAGGNLVINNDRRNVTGVELSAQGRVTDRITLSAGYAYLHGRIENPGQANHGFAIGLMPEHSGYVWADYDVNEKFTVGAGLNFTSFRYTGDYNPATMEGGRLPGHITVDLRADYKFNDRFSVQFNAINLFDALTFEKSHGARHMVPGQGRTFLLTAKTSF